ncbi:unnamed protein product, partial [Phaeothamnion confervicola]
MPTSRPSQVEGAPADLQRYCYNGHHRLHGLKFQGVMNPNGIVSDMYGSVVGRRHESHLLARSNLNNRMATAQAGNPRQYKIYGDAAYPMLSHISRGCRGAVFTPPQRACNLAMSEARIFVEWRFG